MNNFSNWLSELTTDLRGPKNIGPDLSTVVIDRSVVKHIHIQRVKDNPDHDALRQKAEKDLSDYITGRDLKGVVIAIPYGRASKSDPLGQFGYYGFKTYHRDDDGPDLMYFELFKSQIHSDEFIYTEYIDGKIDYNIESTGLDTIRDTVRFMRHYGQESIELFWEEDGERINVEIKVTHDQS